MMKQTDFFQINTLISVREATLLSTQQKSALLRTSDLATAAKLLDEWNFFHFGELSSPDLFLQALKKERQGWFLWSKEIAPELNIAELFLLSDTIHNLKVVIKEQVTGKTLDRLYLENSLYPIEEIKKLLDSENSNSDIPPHWKNQVHETLEDYNLHHSLARIDFRLDAFYYMELMNASVSFGDFDIDALHTAMIDLYHLSILLQARITKEVVPSIAIVKGGYLKDSIWELLKMTSQEQNTFLLGSQYASLWEKLMQLKDITLFDLYADEYLMALCKKAKLQAFGIFPLFAFLFAKLRDIKNVRLILSGKHLKLPEKEIEKRVCISYEL